MLKLNQGAANGRKSLAECFSLLLSFAQAKESKSRINDSSSSNQ